MRRKLRVSASMVRNAISEIGAPWMPRTAVTITSLPRCDEFGDAVGAGAERMHPFQPRRVAEEVLPRLRAEAHDDVGPGGVLDRLLAGAEGLDRQFRMARREILLVPGARRLGMRQEDEEIHGT